MAEVVIMPKLGFNMDEGTLMLWSVAVGDAVKKGEVLFEIETDKTTIPVEATLDGVLLKTLIDEGTKVEVFTPIAVVGEAGEDPDAALAAAGGQSAAGSAPAGEAPAATPAAAPADEAPARTEIAPPEGAKLTPRAKQYAADNGISLSAAAALPGTGWEGGVTERDIKASPLAKKLAAKQGVDLAAVAGTGAGGKVMAADVAAAAAQPAAPANAEKQVLCEAPYTGVRKIIGDRLAQSKFTAPHLYFTEAVDTTNLTAFRKQINENLDEKISVSDLLVKVASKALQKYPQINASLLGERVVQYKSTNVGIAVAGDKGLIVPVIKNAQDKTLSAIARESKDLIERARAGRLTPDEYDGGTFTVSNLGMFGIENFTAIINPPESAILSISSVRKKPVVVTVDGEDTIAIRPMMNIQLTVDHRIIDGLLAAQFIGTFRDLLENPFQIVI